MKSILQDSKICWKCGTTINLHCHHVFSGTANRKKSEKYGMKVWLCARHHNMSAEGVHFDKQFNDELKQYAQIAFEKKYSHEKFMQEFHKNYL